MAAFMINGEAQPPRACDRCYALKERCEWTTIGLVTQCERCVRLGQPCRTVRPKGRPGRRPGAARRAHVERCLAAKDAQSARRSSQQQQQQQQQREQSHGSDEPGPVAGASSMVVSPQRFMWQLSDVSSSDLAVLQRFLFTSPLLDHFSVGSSFSERLRMHVIPQLILSKGTFLDALLACAMSWTDHLGDDEDQKKVVSRLTAALDSSSGSSGGDSKRIAACYRHASSALVTLSSLQVSDRSSMYACLTLGALISTFAIKQRLYDVLAISSRTLGLVDRMYASLPDDEPPNSEQQVFISCLVMWELRGCVFSCAVPTLRFRPPQGPYTDRHVGLCGGLLPLLYDLCVVSHKIAQRAENDQDGEGEEIDDPACEAELDALERALRDWRPASTDDFMTHFQAVEIAHMLCQVQAMRSAALLLVHRLRHPFTRGCPNERPAEMLSMTILNALEATYAATRQTIKCIDLPLLVACIELRGAEERARWLRDVAAFAGFSPEYGVHMRDTLESFWEVLDARERVTWRELTVLGSPFLRQSGAR